jgi:hypothetical protein
MNTPAAREPPEAVGFRAGNVDRTGPRELGVIDVEDLVVEALQRAFGDGDQADRDVEVRQPERRLRQVSRCSRFFSISSRRRMPQKFGISPTAV